MDSIIQLVAQAQRFSCLALRPASYPPTGHEMYIGACGRAPVNLRAAIYTDVHGTGMEEVTRWTKGMGLCNGVAPYAHRCMHG